MHDLSGKKIVIVATHGFEQSELEVPRDRLRSAGATVHVASPEAEKIKGWDMKDWGREVPVDLTVDQVKADDYDAIVIPGGQINPDLLRINERVLALIRDFDRQKKVIAAVCHGPWLLIETGIIKNRKATSYKSIKTDMLNAGAQWVDQPVVTDQGIITSRNPGDLEAFSNKIAEEILEGRHMQRQSASSQAAE
ncbi:type 1 glutamine amidotransferase domain-containing protein [Rhodoligotrophos defluvii]|uniref:type 1 glutamine amidotransferase domain-containing protein n=1 Tax=Rhodoligotrophos defluvii TaxID=2561934 RepID=UPI0010C9AC55|nr:type 1 glutamine amidotransferase domain-containing protein [Rhodoligotrophos defluvii]